METLNRLKATNHEVEFEKQKLSRSLQEVRACLDQEKVQLERLRLANEEELQRLRNANTHLSEQVCTLFPTLL